MKRLRSCSPLLLLLLAIVSGCARLPALDREALKVETSAELKEQLLEHEPHIDIFRVTGPFAVTVQENRPLQLSPKERFVSDFFLSSVNQEAPLAIFLHGHESSKAAHAKQALHLATWGVHSLTVQLPDKGPWDTNGRMLARIVSFIHRSPQVLGARIDVNRIMLIGFSFGASAVAVALAQRAPVAGAILLDPAAIGKSLPDSLRRIEKPVMIIGSDDEVYATRDREHFFDFIRGDVAELSIRGAVHEDAQFPTDLAVEYGSDPSVTEEAQLTFVSALTSAATSLSATGGFDYAWTSFEPGLAAGRFFNPKKK
jgi:hypothetical protein